MVYPYSETFRVRSYECDVYGHVNNAIYLRYLQETARNALAAAGLDPQQMEQISLCEWTPLIDIEYLIPFFNRETVEIVFRPAGVQGNLFFQEFEFHKAVSGELAARAVAACRFIHKEDGSPAPVPPNLLTAFYPHGEPAVATAPAPFPPLPIPSPGIFKVRRRVRWLDVNAKFQVDPATLLSYLEDCGRQVIAAYQWPVERMLATGFAVLLRRNQIEYTNPAVIDDELEIATWISQVRRVAATRQYLVTRASDRQIIARVQALGVWVNLETGLPARFSPTFLADFAPNIVL